MLYLLLDVSLFFSPDEGPMTLASDVCPGAVRPKPEKHNNAEHSRGHLFWIQEGMSGQVHTLVSPAWWWTSHTFKTNPIIFEHCGQEF